MENLIRIVIAVMVLIVIGLLITEDWRSQRQAHHVAGMKSEEKEVHLSRIQSLGNISDNPKISVTKSSSYVEELLLEGVKGENVFWVQRKMLVL